ncbi:MAG: SDR family oxidoreductase, partial [Bdellovibrionales bacterium]|nr:SDR family oxidoreductase [Bdellovibrionales bacterium]
ARTQRKKDVVLITGCSSGLGKALAERLILSRKYRVVVTAREKSFEVLQSLFQESDEVMVRKLDVTDDSHIFEVVNDVCCIWGGINVLINNAGICYRAVVEHMDIHSEMIQLKTNYLGPMSLVRAVLPIMREQRSGRIVNVSSVSGMVSMPTMASYSASKHALEGASESLWYESKPYGIKVTLVEPGFVHSDSFKHVVYSTKAELSASLKGPHSEYYESMAPMIERLMRWTFATPESIAEKMADLLEMDSPPLRLRVTLDAQLFAIFKKILPSRIFHKIMFWLLPGADRWGPHGRKNFISRNNSSDRRVPTICKTEVADRI